MSTPKYSDYIVYVDESGDHSIESINERYPLFVLAFCIMRKDVYAHAISPSLRMLKFAFFGHDMVVFHEHEIRKKLGSFHSLEKTRREQLLGCISDLISTADFTLIPVVIDKLALKQKGADVPHVYHLAMQIGLKQILKFLISKEQENFRTHVIFEARGRLDDLALELEFKKVCDSLNDYLNPLPFDIVVADKKTNSSGLQLADMVARPVGLSILRPYQPNRAFDILRNKIYREVGVQEGQFVYPIKAKGPEVALEAQAPVG